MPRDYLPFDHLLPGLPDNMLQQYAGSNYLLVGNLDATDRAIIRGEVFRTIALKQDLAIGASVWIKVVTPANAILGLNNRDMKSSADKLFYRVYSDVVGGTFDQPMTVAPQNLNPLSGVSTLSTWNIASVNPTSPVGDPTEIDFIPGGTTSGNNSIGGIAPPGSFFLVPPNTTFYVQIKNESDVSATDFRVYFQWNESVLLL